MADKSNIARAVASNQSTVHSNLQCTVLRHLRHDYRKPYAEHNRAAFAALSNALSDPSRPLVFDSGCGVGASTRQLAQRHPDAYVIGIDKSAHRLDKHPRLYHQASDASYHLVRAELEDFWRLAVAAGWRLQHHYLLYPNPWPKARHLARRWHGSPVFPVLLALGGRLELRSNWRLYLEEFALALEIVGKRAWLEMCADQVPLSPFERKYRASGQTCWRCVAELDDAV